MADMWNWINSENPAPDDGGRHNGIQHHRDSGQEATAGDTFALDGYIAELIRFS